MSDTLSGLGLAFATMTTPVMMMHVVWATLLGIIVGALPGLTATMGVALLTTLTYSLDRDAAILVLLCMYVGAIYGGSRSAILLNIPGTPASAATALDGFPLAKQGKAGMAMAIATIGSAFGTLVGIVLLVLIAPPLAAVALKFGSFEFFWLALFGVVISGQLAKAGHPAKGYLAGVIGLSVAMIGSDGIHSAIRFNMGFPEMNGGIGLIPAMVGAFGFAEVLFTMTRGDATMVQKKPEPIRYRELFARSWNYRRTALQSGFIGTFVGIIPGVGEDIGSWASYAAARQHSKERDDFGSGSQEGLMAAETGNSAVVPGSLIPSLTLGVPGSASAAVLIAALYIHGIRPGPMIMVDQPDFIYTVSVMLTFATVAIAIFGLLLTPLFIQVLRIPKYFLMPLVFVMCVIGPYALTQRLFDVWVMFAFGLIGYVLRRLDYPMAPLVLGIILGDLLDKSLRRGLTLSNGSLEPFLTRPISLGFAVIILVTIVFSFPVVRKWWSVHMRLTR